MSKSWKILRPKFGHEGEGMFLYKASGVSCHHIALVSKLGRSANTINYFNPWP